MRQGVKSDREEGSVGVERVIELRRTLPFRNSIYDMPMNISDETSLLKNSWWDGFAIGTLVGAGGLILICIAIVAAMGRL